MRILTLLFLTLLLFSSCYTTHVSTMLNEPAFTKKGEVKIAGAIATDHLEGQAAIAVTNHVGILGGTYQGVSLGDTGFKGTSIYEGALNFFTSLDKNRKHLISISSGAFTGSKNTQQHVNHPLIRNKKIEADTKHKGFFLQLAYTLNSFNSINKNRTTFLLKSELIHYSSYSTNITNFSSTGYYFYKVNFSARSMETRQSRLAIIHSRQKKDKSSFWQFQLGVNLMDGFKIDKINRVFGNYKNDPEKNFENMVHANAFPLFFNVVFGFKL